jgi:VanZ family protein
LVTVNWKHIEQRVLQSKWLSNPALVLLVLWGLFIIYATLLPFNFRAPAELIRQRLERLWARPLRGGSWKDVQSNVLLFIPWGFLLSISMVRRRAGLIMTVFVAMCTGAVLSGSVEILQLFAPKRTTSFIDLVTNSFGATVGAIAGWPWARLVWPDVKVRAPQVIGALPLSACAVATGVGIFVAGLSPFWLKPAPRDVKAALKAAQLVPFGISAQGQARSAKPLNWAAELLTWVLAGGLFALAGRELRLSESRAIGMAIAAAGVLCLAIETCQLVLPERDVDATSVVLAILGSSAGAWLVKRFVARDLRGPIMPALMLWCLAVIFTYWNPPEFTWPERPYWRLERVVPFWSYFYSRTLADLADVIGQVLIFIPLGALLAARTHRQSFVGALVIGLAVGVVIEVGQACLPGRTADITDAISAAAGTAVGLALWRWGEWIRTSSAGVARYRVGRRAGIRA